MTDQQAPTEPTYVCHLHGTDGLPHRKVKPEIFDGQWYWVCRDEDDCQVDLPAEAPSEPYTIRPESNLDARVAFKRLTGTEFRLTPWEALTAIKVTADTITTSVTTYEVDERKAVTILKARGIRLTQFKLTETGWAQTFRMPVVWDIDFEPIHYSHFGPGKTPAEWLAAREFERACYRPGSDAQPMDSSARVNSAPEYTTVRMVRHWG